MRAIALGVLLSAHGLHLHSRWRAHRSSSSSFLECQAEPDDSVAFPSSPVITSRRAMFDSMYLPQTPEEEVLTYKIGEQKAPSSALQQLTPSEIYVRPPSSTSEEEEDEEDDEDEYDDDDGEEGDEDEGEVVEVIDKFRFKVSASDLQRAIKMRTELKAKQILTEDRDGEDYQQQQQQQQLLMDSDFIDRLANAQAMQQEEQDEAELTDGKGRVILRLEMDYEELEAMVRLEGDLKGLPQVENTITSQQDTSTTAPTNNDLGKKRRGAVAYDTEKMIEAERSIAISSLPSMAALSTTHLTSSSSTTKNWSFAYFSFGEVADTLLGCAFVGLLLAAFIKACDFGSQLALEKFFSLTGALSSRKLPLAVAKTAVEASREGAKRWAKPYLTCSVLAFMLLKNLVGWWREAMAFRGIGYRDKNVFGF